MRTQTFPELQEAYEDTNHGQDVNDLSERKSLLKVRLVALSRIREVG